MTKIPPGPRKLRYFVYLLVGVIHLFVLGVVISEFYGFTLLESIMRYFVENPIVLFEIAGILSMLVLAGIGVIKVSELLESDQFR